MEYASIRGNDSLDYAKNATWNLFHSYIDAHSQILIDEYTVDGVQTISRLQPQRASTNVSDQRIYNILFKQVIHKGWDSAINYIKYSRMIKPWQFQWKIVTLRIS